MRSPFLITVEKGIVLNNSFGSIHPYPQAGFQYSDNKKQNGERFALPVIHHVALLYNDVLYHIGKFFIRFAILLN